jgi:hypothetical protein
MWLAVAAMAVVSLARVEAGVDNATVYTNPVLQFLAGQQSAANNAATGAPQYVHFGSARKGSVAFLQNTGAGAWMAVLPVLFIGLVAPLSLISSKSLISLGRTPSAPALPGSFQRPPPSLL